MKIRRLGNRIAVNNQSIGIVLPLIHDNMLFVLWLVLIMNDNYKRQHPNFTAEIHDLLYSHLICRTAY